MFQTVLRLGTYAAKAPAYNSLKVCKGTMFFLPLPLNKTAETLREVDDPTKVVQSGLPTPELYIIVKDKPTKSTVLWQSLTSVALFYNLIHHSSSCWSS